MKQGVRLADVVASLSLATDLGTGHSFEQSLRACLLAVRFAGLLGLDRRTLRETYYLTLLRYVGCTADSHRADLFGDEIALGVEIDSVELWNAPAMLRALVSLVGRGESLPVRAGRFASRVPVGIQRSREAAVAHCEVSQGIAASLGLGDLAGPGLGQVFERWDGQGVPGTAKGDAIRIAAQIAHLAIDAELFHRLHDRDTAIAILRDRSGTTHSPELVVRFAGCAEGLFADLPEGSAWDAVLEAEPDRHPDPDLDSVLAVFADFVDVRSPDTYGHSRAVAALAERAARTLGLGEDRAALVRRAGLVHDIGMVGISYTTVQKRGGLSLLERDRIQLHPHYTEQVLSRSPLLAAIGKVAGRHHERIDGSGYHRGLPAVAIDQPARILAVAEIYQSLIEPRPYRPAHSPDAAVALIWNETRRGAIDLDAAAAVLHAAGQAPAPVSQRPGGLTDREIDVLRLLVQGYTKKQIAAELVVSPHTADHHVRHIYDKIGVSTRAAAALFAVQHQLVNSHTE